MSEDKTTRPTDQNRETGIASLMRTLDICRSEADYIWNDAASDDDDPRDDDEEDGGQDCGLMADGQCLLAGSEWCDWDCGKLR